MNGHCNHLALKFSVCVKERQDRLLQCIGYLSFTKDRIKHDLLQTQVLVLQLNFLNYSLRASLLSKIMSYDTVKKFMKGQVKICFGQLKILVRYLIN